MSAFLLLFSRLMVDNCTFDRSYFVTSSSLSMFVCTSSQVMIRKRLLNDIDSIYPFVACDAYFAFEAFYGVRATTYAITAIVAPCTGSSSIFRRINKGRVCEVFYLLWPLSPALNRHGRALEETVFSRVEYLYAYLLRSKQLIEVSDQNHASGLKSSPCLMNRQ